MKKTLYGTKKEKRNKTTLAILHMVTSIRTPGLPRQEAYKSINHTTPPNKKLAVEYTAITRTRRRHAQNKKAAPRTTGSHILPNNNLCT